MSHLFASFLGVDESTPCVSSEVASLETQPNVAGSCCMLLRLCACLLYALCTAVLKAQRRGVGLVAVASVDERLSVAALRIRAAHHRNETKVLLLSDSHQLLKLPIFFSELFSLDAPCSSRSSPMKSSKSRPGRHPEPGGACN